MRYSIFNINFVIHIRYEYKLLRIFKSLTSIAFAYVGIIKRFYNNNNKLYLCNASIPTQKCDILYIFISNNPMLSKIS